MSNQIMLNSEFLNDYVAYVRTEYQITVTNCYKGIERAQKDIMREFGMEQNSENLMKFSDHVFKPNMEIIERMNNKIVQKENELKQQALAHFLELSFSWSNGVGIVSIEKVHLPNSYFKYTNKSADEHHTSEFMQRLQEASDDPAVSAFMSRLEAIRNGY